MSNGVRRLLRIGRNTTDLDHAIAFYREALGFHVDEISNDPPAWMRLPEVNVMPSRCAWLSLGVQQIELTEFLNTAPYPADSSSCDLWFQHCAIVVNDMNAACQRVMQHGAKPITQDGPQTLPPSTGSVSAFKFRDPDGHPLELIHFPDDAGDPGWLHAAIDPHHPALGIDHSAINVGDVERSIAFYELLGLHVAERGVNLGIEQQRLDDLDGVMVDVIALHPAAVRTPHVELLGYRQPRGRQSPRHDATAVVADRLVWCAGNIEALLNAMPDAVVACGRIDGIRLALLHDPDGHLTVLSEPGA